MNIFHIFKVTVSKLYHYAFQIKVYIQLSLKVKLSLFQIFAFNVSDFFFILKIIYEVITFLGFIFYRFRKMVPSFRFVSLKLQVSWCMVKITNDIKQICFCNQSSKGTTQFPWEVDIDREISIKMKRFYSKIHLFSIMI